jgi:hypothetical protein
MEHVGSPISMRNGSKFMQHLHEKSKVANDSQVLEKEMRISTYIKRTLATRTNVAPEQRSFPFISAIVSRSAKICMRVHKRESVSKFSLSKRIYSAQTSLRSMFCDYHSLCPAESPQKHLLSKSYNHI